MKSTGDIIRDARTKLGLTQPQLAELVGVSKGTISMWETGVTKPNGSNLLNLAAHIKLSPLYIATGQLPAAADGPEIKSETGGNDPVLEEVSKIMMDLSKEDRKTAVDILRALSRRPDS